MEPARVSNCYKYSNTQHLKITTVSGSCPDGTTKTQYTHTSSLCGASYTYYDCKVDCTGCSNCTDNASWTAGNTGYERRTKKTCDYDTCQCKTSTEYRCAKGYYGTSFTGTTGCTRCPRDGDDGPYGTTDSAGLRQITNCFIPAGATFTDASGFGEYPGRCDYERDDFVIIDECTIGSEDFCQSTSDCPSFYTCNTTTNCCEVRVIGGGDIIVGGGDLVIP